MKCPRCNGMMIYERYQDMLEVFYAWRCVICGEVLDDVVLKNRDEHKEQDKEAASNI